ncbi:ribonuclease 1-like [Phragmites australis]|uniref:ribonuclease 1-like n=1 Tax=Phragmites australis TaxID=29695 RepID=UPI002D78E319|nr:ribonuclease 1-like [Phragmites australis]
MTKLVLVSLALLLSLLAVSSTAEEFDFFYFVQQWPGSFCDTWRGCCFPDTGKPAADFGIHGLWPNYAECRGRHGVARAALGDDALLSIVGRRGRCWPQYCDDGNPLQLWEIRDLVASLDKSWPTLSCKSGRSLEFWSYEWKKHGTCSNLEQHEFFEAALALKARHNLTSILADAGIVPSEDESYFLSSIRDAIAQGTGFKANLECNRDADGESQLYQVYQCVGRDGKKLIDCPLEMRSKCADRVKLPVF